MIFWTIVEAVIAACIILFFVTQVFIPLWNGTKLFPWRGRRKLVAQLKDVKDEEEKEELLSEIDEEVKKLKKIREEKKEDERLREQSSAVGPGKDQTGS